MQDWEQNPPSAPEKFRGAIPRGGHERLCGIFLVFSCFGPQGGPGNRQQSTVQQSTVQLISL